jgi:hypothetical protein
MTTNGTSRATWALVAAGTGAAGVLAYFGAAFLPVPDAIGRLFAFAFGPLLGFSFLGMYRYMSEYRDGPVLQFATLSGIIASAMVTAMLVVQVGNNMVRQSSLAEAETEAARETVLLAWRAVNQVQYLLDVVWDIFICVAAILLAVAMLNHPRFGKIWGGLGVVFGALLLFFNMYTFPFPPADVGSIDWGPLLALWFLAVFIRMFFLARRPSGSTTEARA